MASNVSWAATSSETWLTITGESGTGNGTVTLTAPEYTGKEARKATVTVTGGGLSRTVEVTQLGDSHSLEVTPSTIKFDAETDASGIIVASNVEWTAEISYEGNDNNWLTITPNRGGKGTMTMNLNVTEYTGSEARKAIILITGGELSRSVEVTQRKTYVIPDTNMVLLTVKGEEKVINIKSDVHWEIEYEKNTNAWLVINGSSSGKVSGGTDNEERTESIAISSSSINESTIPRTATIIVNWKNHKDEEKKSIVTITQERSPDIPILKLLNSKELDVLESTIDETAVIEVEPVANFEGFEPNRWSYKWVIDDTELSKEKKSECHFTGLNERKVYPVTATIYYNDLESINSTLNFNVFPSPKIPTGLVKKGSGASGIMVASIDGVSDDELKNNGYEFVFGYGDGDKSDGISSNRYWQYSDKSVVQNDITNKWVYTQWNVTTRSGSTRTVKSKYRYNTVGSKTPTPNTTRGTTAIESIEGTAIYISNDRLIAHVANPAKAMIYVTSLSGTVVKQLTFSPSCDFDEPLDLNGLPAGLYIVRCTIGSKSVEQKVVIK